MAMDAEENRLYWVNSGTATIQYLDLTHMNVTTVSISILVANTILKTQKIPVDIDTKSLLTVYRVSRTTFCLVYLCCV